MNDPVWSKIGTAGRTYISGSLPKHLTWDNGVASVFRDLPIAAAESGYWMKPWACDQQESTQSLAALHRPLAVDVCIAREQQDVVLPLMIALSMVMLDTLSAPQGAVPEEDHLGQPPPAAVRVDMAERDRRPLIGLN
jgi:hypothetical protein